MEGNLCGVARSLHVIGGWWSLLIVHDALAGVRRFSDFQPGNRGPAEWHENYPVGQKCARGEGDQVI